MKLKLALKSLSGSSYEIGYSLANIIKQKYGINYLDQQVKKMRHSFLYSALGMNFTLENSFINEASTYLREALKSYHPNLISEFEGLADGLEEPVEKVMAFVMNFGNGTGCTHFFVNGFHTHNYDDHPRNVDMQFLKVNPDHGYESAGGSAAQIGRFDGINEKGLCASLSWGAGEPGNNLILSAELFVRILLDTCTNTKEAIELFKKVGYGSPNNLLISDAQGNAVVIENSRKVSSIRKADNEVLFCANSYLSNEMISEQKYKNPTTKWREAFMTTHLTDSVSLVEIKDLLTQNYPQGLFEPYYEEELGTLWSVVFEPLQRRATILVGEKENRIEKEIYLKSKEVNQDEVLSVIVPKATTDQR